MASYLLFPHFSLLLIFSLPLSTADIPIRSICTENSSYSPNSIFQINLNSLLDSLFSSAPVTGFANNTAGDNPDRVYGLALCRADVSPTTCHSCLAGDPQGVAKACPLKREATIFYDLCLLRYSDKDFFGKSSSKIFFTTNGQKLLSIVWYSLVVCWEISWMSWLRVSPGRRWWSPYIQLGTVTPATCTGSFSVREIYRRRPANPVSEKLSITLLSVVGRRTLPEFMATAVFFVTTQFSSTTTPLYAKVFINSNFGFSFIWICKSTIDR